MQLKNWLLELQAAIGAHASAAETCDFVRATGVNALGYLALPQRLPSPAEVAFKGAVRGCDLVDPD
jgi:hypothetical protein